MSGAYLQRPPLDLAPLVAQVSAPGAGRRGVASSARCGTTTPAARCCGWNTRAYGPMAEAECARIVEEAERRWPVRVALRHRIGTLEIGDAAVGSWWPRRRTGTRPLMPAAS